MNIINRLQKLTAEGFRALSGRVRALEAAWLQQSTEIMKLHARISAIEAVVLGDGK